MHLKPTHLLLILFLACVGIGCERKTPNNLNSDNYLNSQNEIQSAAADSITYYLDEANNKEYTFEKRKNLAWKAYAVTQKLNDSLKAKYFINIGNWFYYTNDFETYKYFYYRILKIAVRGNNKRAEARALINMGGYYLENNYRSDSATYYYNKAIKAYTILKDTLRLGMTLRNLAIVQQNENNFLESEASINKAISYFEIANNDEYLGYTYNTLGVLVDELERPEEAIKYYKLSLTYKKKLPRNLVNKLYETYPINNIGYAYEELEMYNEALNYYQQALTYDHFFEELPHFYAQVLSNIAHTNFKLGNTENLPQLYFEALKISDSLNDIPRIIEHKMHLAEYYKENDSIELAKKYAHDAKNLSEKSKHKGKLLGVLLMLSQIETGKKALDYTSLYIKMQDSLKKNEINTAKELFANINHDLDKITQQKDEIAQKNEKITNQKELLALLVILLFMTFTTLYFLRLKKYKKYKEKFEQILSEESRSIGSTETAPPSKKKDLDLDKGIVNNILSHLKEFEGGSEYLQKGITIVELSKKFNTNSSYLSKIINTYKEKNFTAYINDLKINYVVKRFQYDKKFRLFTIRAIAEEIGFNTPQTFSAAFYKKTGIYPSYFISQLNKLEEVNEVRD